MNKNFKIGSLFRMIDAFEYDLLKINDIGIICDDGSFEVPDLKIVFNFLPDDKNSLVLRFNLNNLTAPTPLLDYGFVEAKDFMPYLK